MAQARLQVVQQQLLWALVQAWGRWQQLEVSLNFEQAQKQTLGQLLEQIQQGYGSGQGSLSQVALIRRRLAMSAARQVQLQQQQQQQAAIVMALTGVHDLTPVAAPELKTLSHMVQPDWYQTPTLQVLQQQIRTVQAQQRIAEAEYQGQLSVFATGVRNDSGGRFYDDMQGVRVGIRYQIPLMTGGRLEAESSAANARVRKLLSLREAQLRILRQQWQQAQAVLETAPVRELALKEALKASSIDRQARLALLRSGEVSIQTVLESLLAQYRIERDLALNRWQAWEAVQQQHYLAGRLSS
jgi:outer membrane protein